MLSKLLNELHTRFPRLETVGSFVMKTGVPILVTSLTMTGSILGIRHFGFLQGAELAAYDHFIQAQPDKGPDDRLLVVGIDEIDLQTLQEWPVSDRTLANLIKKLETHQPRVIGIDVMRDIPIEPGRAELLQQLQQSDRLVIVCKANSQREFGVAPPPGVGLEKVGTADLVIDPGGILRRSLLWLTPPPSNLIIKRHLCNDPNNTLLSLSFNVALTYLEKLKIEPEITETEELKLGNTILPKFQPNTGGYRNADAGGYQLLLHYRSQDKSVAQVRLTDVLNGKVAPELIRDRIVLVGYTTPQAKDDFYTPYSSSKDDLQKMPGVIVHAQSASQILSAVLDRQSLIWVWSFPSEMAWVLGWSLVGGILAWYLRHPFWFSVTAAGASGAVYAISLLIFFQAGWIPFVPAIAAFMTTAVGVVLLDRFNNSTYGQTVYKTVKTFLKLEVDIDEEKLEKQVAEITETDYFKDLQDTVKSLREQQKGVETDSRLFSNFKPPQETSDRLQSPLEKAQSSDIFNFQTTISNAEQSEAYEFDFIKDIKRESQQLPRKKDLSDAEEYEFDFIQEIKQESQQLKRNGSELNPDEPKKSHSEALNQNSDRSKTEGSSSPTESSGQASDNGLQTYQKFTLDTPSTLIEDDDTNSDYFDFLQQESRRLKESHQDQSS